MAPLLAATCVKAAIAGRLETLHDFNAQLVLASRLAGLAAPVDGVAAELQNAAGWEAESRRARELGFGGKLCIHPRQVAAVNQGFAPAAGELVWAKRVVEAMRGQATAVVDGQFVDRPMLLRAYGILATEQAVA